MIKEFVIQNDCDGICVRDYVRSVLSYSAGTLKKLKYNGRISVDGNDVFADFKLSAGSTLKLEFPEERSETIAPENIEIDVLYEDNDFLAVNKPSNMPVHPSQNHRSGTLANAVCHRYRNEPFVFRALTRLDIDTTGVVIVAKNRVFAAAFSKGMPFKEYLAVCLGVPKEKAGVVDVPIARADGIIKRCASPCGKPSLTEYRVLAEADGMSLVRCVPVTGRTHQIRVHMAYIGCPLLGDYLYGEEIPGERTRLHCEKVSFVHPITHREISITAPIPSDFTYVNEAFFR